MEDLAFPVRLLKVGYTYTREVGIAGTKIRYERDAAQNWE